MILFKSNQPFQEYRYEKEDELEREVTENSKLFFGKDTIFIEVKKKIETKSFGGSIPDGFLFDFSDKENPEFYLIEIELLRHDFFKHIFPQITKFFAFFKSSKNQAELVEKIFSIINNSPDLKKEFKKYLGEKEIYKSLKDTIENSQKILLILDGDKMELPEVIDTYTDTWGKMVHTMVIKKYTNQNEFIYSLDPEFEGLEIPVETEIDDGEEDVGEDTPFTEEYHLEGLNSEIKNIYLKIKSNLQGKDKSIIFNPQKYYISIRISKNVAYLKFRKKKVVMVVMLPEDIIEKNIKYYNITKLSPSVKQFYNGPCARINVDNSTHLDEVIDLLGLALGIK